MKKSNNVLVFLVIILSIAVIALTGFIIYDKTVSKDTNDKENNSDISNIDTENIATNILDGIVGNWGSVRENSCYFVTISKEDNKYNYIYGEYGTDGTLTGDIIEYKAIGNDKLYLKVYFPKKVTEFSESLEKTDEYVINTSQLSSNIIIINNQEKEKVTGSFEDFFNSKIPNRF